MTNVCIEVTEISVVKCRTFTETNRNRSLTAIKNSSIVLITVNSYGNKKSFASKGIKSCKILSEEPK